MDERKIQKGTQGVKILLSTQEQLEGQVFLRLHEAHHDGRQKVGDLLNQGLTFIPVKTGSDAFLLSTSQIVTLETALEFERDDTMTLGKKYDVRISMIHGKEIAGNIFVNLPDDSSRIKDYFNQPVRFFAVSRPESILYVNGAFILSVSHRESI